MPKPCSISLALALALAMAASSVHASSADDLDALLALSLEELGAIQVTAASRNATPLTETPSSVYVIHGEELRTLGIRSLPEALRLAPNLHVASINASSYAVSARGMKTSLSNKLLVMVDGRPIYTPLFAGVLWDMQAVPMDEIERIEVVSGPGAAAWGANAVNGVINVITRPAASLEGGYARGWAGQDGNGMAAGQAFSAGGDGAVRLYALRNVTEPSEDAQGGRLPDGWTQRQAGFRGDWQRGDDHFRVQGDVLRGESSLRASGAIEVSAHNLLGRWSRSTGQEGQWSVQAYLDVVDRLDPQVIRDRMTIGAVELVRDARVGGHGLSWGLGYRQARDESSRGALGRLDPDERTLRWGHAFVQDRLALSGRVALELGLRLDSNSYTGVEVLPTARISLRQAGGGLLWGAASRAVRSPARFDREFFFPATEPFIITGGPDFESEVSNVAELGYRAQPTDWLSFSITGFHHWHRGLRGGAIAPSGLSIVIANRVDGRTYGAEGWATMRMPGEWELAAGFLELRQSLHLQPGFADRNAVRDQGNDPERQLLLRTTHRLGERHRVSAFARYVGTLPDPHIPSYLQVDARWSYRPGERVEIGAGVRNLLDARHAELQPTGGLATSEFGRSASLDLRVTW